MAIIKVTREDLAKFKLIQPPGWYAFEITEVKEPHLSKGKTSNVQETTFTVLHDSQNGESQRGIECVQYFNDKGTFIVLEVAAAAEGVTQEELLGTEESLSIELNNLVGKKVWCEVTHRVDKGNVYNDLNNFMPYGKETPF